jgi:hypothetical protein
VQSSIGPSITLTRRKSSWPYDNDKMLFLTMTKSMVEGLQKIERKVSTAPRDEVEFDKSNKLHQLSDEDAGDNEGRKQNTNSDLSSSPCSTGTGNVGYSSTGHSLLLSPCLGNPISHGQVINLSMQLREAGFEPYRLEDLLRGSNVYIAPPPPKSEPVSRSLFCTS